MAVAVFLTYKDNLMSCVVTYEALGTGVLVTCSGHVSAEDIRKVNADFVFSKENARKLRYKIWDFSNVTSKQISNNDMYAFAMQDKMAAQTNPNQVIAIVGPKHLFNGYDQVFHIYEEVWSGFKSKTFETLQEARKWIAFHFSEDRDGEKTTPGACTDESYP